MATREVINLSGFDLTPQDLFKLSTGHTRIDFSKECIDRVVSSRKVITDIVASNKVVYGVNTGFGLFQNVVVTEDQTIELQENLIRSHAAGVGEPLRKETTRMMLALRINILCKGFSGISKENLLKMKEAFNNDCIPVVPRQGTVGASGDLAPLSHIALSLMGESEMWDETGKEKLCSKEVLRSKGCEPIKLGAKEGLAMINGTQLITSIGCEALIRSENIIKQAIIVAALSCEALFGTARAFNPHIHNARPHFGQKYVAEFLRKLLPPSIKDDNFDKLVEGDMLYSELKMSTGKAKEATQDAYSLRCTPQVYGISYDTVQFARSILEIEINSATDNPMVIQELNETMSGGNFHGEYPAKACDYLAIGVQEIGQMSERRLERMCNPACSEKTAYLPAFAIRNGGLNSGFMIAHCTAAALVSENKVYSHPASADSISTSAAQEDHVSMGGMAARKALKVVENIEYVIAIEMLCALTCLDLHGKATTKPLQAVWDYVRREIPSYDKDRYIKPEIEKAAEMLRNADILRICGEVLGKDMM